MHTLHLSASGWTGGFCEPLDNKRDSAEIRALSDLINGADCQIAPKCDDIEGDQVPLESNIRNIKTCRSEGHGFKSQCRQDYFSHVSR